MLQPAGVYVDAAMSSPLLVVAGIPVLSKEVQQRLNEFLAVSNIFVFLFQPLSVDQSQSEKNEATTATKMKPRRPSHCSVVDAARPHLLHGCDQKLRPAAHLHTMHAIDL